MAEMFDSDSKNEFGGFEIWDVNAAEEKYLQRMEALVDIDSDENSDDFDSDDDVALAQFTRWSEHLRPVGIKDFTGPNPGPSTIMEKEKMEQDFFHLIFPETLYGDIATQNKCIRYTVHCRETKLGMVPNYV